ncbi:MAG: 50S ribosomal protein L4 [Planctomycetes bacterium]|nr:50S ribosomal protein L4 [Planctomycetota bacterium]
MITVAVYNKEGREIESLEIAEADLGGRIRADLLKQAIVMYHANKRIGTAATKSRGMVAGSTKKIYRQKGTGNARAGNIRTVVRRGGGVAFAKTHRDFGKNMPKKQRQLATKSAILAKLLKECVVIVDRLEFTQPKTKDFVRVLDNLKIDRSCLVAIQGQDENLYKSIRNIPKVNVILVDDLNAGDICRKQKMLFTKDAFLKVLGGSENEKN